jgi:hypothetical protein
MKTSLGIKIMRIEDENNDKTRGKKRRTIIGQNGGRKFEPFSICLDRICGLTY